MSENTKNFLEKIKSVPKKYYVIGGILVLLLFLFIRKRRLSDSQNSINSDGMAAAMSLPNGIAYAPMSGGGTGGGEYSQPDISEIFGKNPILPKTPDYPFATNPGYQNNYSNLPTKTDGLNVTADVNFTGGTGQYTSEGHEITVGELADYVKYNPIDTVPGLQKMYEYGHSIGLNNVSLPWLRYVAQKVTGQNSFFDWQPQSVNDALVNAQLQPGTVINRGASIPVPVPQAAVVSNSDILSFWAANKNDPNAIKAAQAQYGVSDSRLYELTNSHPAPQPAQQSAPQSAPQPNQYRPPSDAEILQFYNHNSGNEAAIRQAQSQYGVDDSRLHWLVSQQNQGSKNTDR